MLRKARKLSALLKITGPLSVATGNTIASQATPQDIKIIYIVYFSQVTYFPTSPHHWTLSATTTCSTHSGRPTDITMLYSMMMIIIMMMTMTYLMISLILKLLNHLGNQRKLIRRCLLLRYCCFFDHSSSTSVSHLADDICKAP